ncbi:hypothetical protein C8F01DRAFT_1339663 [Mycena amicta]|nr:hypothetical protein C8F01DRAFT_1339663 [Mycena amicta]
MPLKEEVLGALLNARTAFLDDPEVFTAQDFLEATSTEPGVCTATRFWAREPTPDQPAKARKNDASRSASIAELGATAATAQIRAQRKIELDGGPAVGPARSSNVKAKGRKRDTSTLVDDLIIQEEEPSASGDKMVPVVYCIGCDLRNAQRNPKRIKSHAIGCSKIQANFPSLYKKLIAESSSNLKSETAHKAQAGRHHDDEPPLDPDLPDAEVGDAAPTQGKINEYFEPVKMTPMRQAAIDLALFQLVICAALPFSFVENPWLVNLLLILAPNYITPEHTAFFTAQITKQLAVFMSGLAKFLRGRFYLTLSLDRWSTHAHDEVYTFHTTTPSRRSIFTAGHVFKGVSVTGAALFDTMTVKISGNTLQRRIVRSLATGAQTYALRVGAFTRNLGKLFKADLVIVSSISNYFGQSNLGTGVLGIERRLEGIRTGINRHRKRNSAQAISSHAQFRSVCQLSFIQSGELEFKTATSKKLKAYLEPGPAHYGFLAQLDTMIKLFEAGANGITTLEGQNTNCGDVLYVWVTIAWHLEQLLGTESFDYIEHGALRLLMPTVKEGETLPSDKWPPLLKRLPARSSGDSQGGAATNGHDISDRRVQRRRVKPLSSASFVNFLELRANVTN